MTTQRPFSELEWQMTPEMVRQYIVLLEQKLNYMQLRVASHEKRIEKLEDKEKFPQLQQAALIGPAV